jgi:hypothetical protein
MGAESWEGCWEEGDRAGDRGLPSASTCHPLQVDLVPVTVPDPCKLDWPGYGLSLFSVPFDTKPKQWHSAHRKGGDTDDIR